MAGGRSAALWRRWVATARRRASIAHTAAAVAAAAAAAAAAALVRGSGGGGASARVRLAAAHRADAAAAARAAGGVSVAAVAASSRASSSADAARTSRAIALASAAAAAAAPCFYAPAALAGCLPPRGCCLQRYQRRRRRCLLPHRRLLLTLRCSTTPRPGMACKGPSHWRSWRHSARRWFACSAGTRSACGAPARRRWMPCWRARCCHHELAMLQQADRMAARHQSVAWRSFEEGRGVAATVVCDDGVFRSHHYASARATQSTACAAAATRACVSETAHPQRD